ncbi:hypothetical protein [Acidiphilium angustum]|uniref:hypothetical protein n=1 Tax=Acidiphilium angustum TaxID=523 RepID=UPI0004949EE2|nr:hypothetical protein [Acidiphilium angustum]
MLTIAMKIFGFIAPSLSKVAPFLIVGIVLVAGGGILWLRLHQDAARIATLSAQVQGANAVISQQKSVNSADQAAIALLQSQAVAWQHAESVVASDYEQQQQVEQTVNASIDSQTLPVAQISACSAPQGSPPQTDAFVAPVLETTLKSIASAP